MVGKRRAGFFGRAVRRLRNRWAARRVKKTPVVRWARGVREQAEFKEKVTSPGKGRSSPAHEDAKRILGAARQVEADTVRGVRASFPVGTVRKATASRRARKGLRLLRNRKASAWRPSSVVRVVPRDVRSPRHLFRKESRN